MMNTTDVDPLYSRLKKLAERLGVIVVEHIEFPEGLGNRVDGFYYRCCGASRTKSFICIDRRLESPEKRARVLAHEIGHHVLHPGCGDGIWDAETRKTIEPQAERFAAKILRAMRRDMDAQASRP